MSNLIKLTFLLPTPGPIRHSRFGYMGIETRGKSPGDPDEDNDEDNAARSAIMPTIWAMYIGRLSLKHEGDLERHLEVSAPRQLRLVRTVRGTVDTTNRPSTWRGFSAIILRLWS